MHKKSYRSTNDYVSSQQNKAHQKRMCWICIWNSLLYSHEKFDILIQIYIPLCSLGCINSYINSASSFQADSICQQPAVGVGTTEIIGYFMSNQTDNLYIM